MGSLLLAAGCSSAGSTGTGSRLSGSVQPTATVGRADLAAPAFTIAALGDVPYGAAEVAKLSGWIKQVDAARPAFMVHVGDVRDGDTRCDDAYFRKVHGILDAVSGALVFTPGDNDWADCHRSVAGDYDPMERLAALRRLFYRDPAKSLGRAPLAVDSQAAEGYPENARWTRGRVHFATVHLVGSGDALDPWDGKYAGASGQKLQQAAQQERMQAALANLNQTFDRAQREKAHAVVIFTQVDFFAKAQIRALEPVVQLLAARVRSLGRPVLLVNGDSHRFVDETPLGQGSEWLAGYGLREPVPDLRRITVPGDENKVLGWVEISVAAAADASVITAKMVPYT